MVIRFVYIESVVSFAAGVVTLVSALIQSLYGCWASFWTGKQLFSLLLPPNFDYYSNGELFNDGELIISSKALDWFRDYDSNIVHSLVQQF